MWGTLALFNNQYLLPAGGFNMDHLREVVLRFRDHPALLAWDLVDEPDGQGNLTPQQAADAARLVRELDPNHLVWVNLCLPTQGLDWLDSSDVWSFDTYPLPVQGLAGYDAWMRIADESVVGTRPLGTCLQTYQAPGLPMPTPDQLRASALLHVIHGFSWYGYYSYYDGPPSGCLARSPELLSYVTALNAELVRLTPAIVGEGQWRQVAVEGAAGFCQAATKEAGGKRWLVVVSGSNEPTEVGLHVSGTRARTVTGAAAELSIEGGVLRVTLEPWGARVLEVE
jgi:hypothetical protein